MNQLVYKNLYSLKYGLGDRHVQRVKEGNCIKYIELSTPLWSLSYTPLIIFSSKVWGITYSGTNNYFGGYSCSYNIFNASVTASRVTTSGSCKMMILLTRFLLPAR